ncbi:hypothetical protein [Zooshikella ganghwensis]|uniref:hypothetical protein n=1 Tax=Zooshikella ganghwensis TaxID=202772 RepID=UPI001058AE79|nr:hypothetical protein [Zooshikella ganghwensis]
MTDDTVKRYKQSILSDYFVIIDPESHEYHLVESNYDIEEGQRNRTLCTEVIQHATFADVLTNQRMSEVCLICKAILLRRIENMPHAVKKAKALKEQQEELSTEISPQQLSLLQ